LYAAELDTQTANAYVEEISGAHSQSTSNMATLAIRITNLKSNQGKVMALLFANDLGFPDDPIVAHRQGFGKIADGGSEIVFQNLKYGTYAFTIFHDENDDSKLNKHWYGKPEEGVATSNDITPKFRPPSFKECSFQFTGDSKISVAIHYLDD